MMVIAHRGASGYRPENSLSAFKYALELGVAMVELDVYLCASGEIMVIHDDDVSLTTNGQGRVTEMNFDQLRILQLANGEKIPTLQEVIDLIDHRIPINIELKGPNTADALAKLLQLYLDKNWDNKDFVVSSFDLEQLSLFKQKCPDIEIGLLFEPHQMPDNIIEVSKRYQAKFLGLDFNVISLSLVEMLHHADLQVYAWTVNDKKIADTMKAYGVDAIFSDYPDKI